MYLIPPPPARGAIVRVRWDTDCSPVVEEVYTRGDWWTEAWKRVLVLREGWPGYMVQVERIGGE